MRPQRSSAGIGTVSPAVTARILGESRRSEAGGSLLYPSSARVDPTLWPETESSTLTSRLYRPGARLNRTISTPKADGPRTLAGAWFCHDCCSRVSPGESVTLTPTL